MVSNSFLLLKRALLGLLMLQSLIVFMASVYIIEQHKYIKLNIFSLFSVTLCFILLYGFQVMAVLGEHFHKVTISLMLNVGVTVPYIVGIIALLLSNQNRNNFILVVHVAVLLLSLIVVGTMVAFFWNLRANRLAGFNRFDTQPNLSDSCDAEYEMVVFGERSQPDQLYPEIRHLDI